MNSSLKAEKNDDFALRVRDTTSTILYFSGLFSLNSKNFTIKLSSLSMLSLICSCCDDSSKTSCELRVFLGFSVLA